jgi:hypothetical protein
MDILILLLLLTILARGSNLASTSNVSVSKKEFLECLNRVEAPAVFVMERAFLWVLGAPRHYYICVYKGLYLHVTSFAPLSLPASADTIRVRKW